MLEDYATTDGVHNLENVQKSPYPFPGERVGSGDETSSRAVNCLTPKFGKGWSLSGVINDYLQIAQLVGYWMVRGSAAVHESTAPTSISEPDVSERNHGNHFPIM